jgi:cysteinyl-tRNA synthetase
LRNLFEKGFQAAEIRYLLVSVRYRKQLNFTLEGLKEARIDLDRIKQFMFRLNTAKVGPGRNEKVSAAISQARHDFDAALDDDLNTSEALASLFVLMKQCNVALDAGQIQEDDRAEILAWLNLIDERLAIIPPMEQRVHGDEEIEALIVQRNEARKNRDFAASDRIRQELLDRGVLIEDTREGTRWRRK